jgi:hypothetical protein
VDIVAGLGQIDWVQKVTYSGTNSQSPMWMVNAAKAKITIFLCELNIIIIAPLSLTSVSETLVLARKKKAP